MGLSVHHAYGNAIAAEDIDDQDRALHVLFATIQESRSWLAKPHMFTYEQVAIALFRLYHIDGWQPARTYFFNITGIFLPTESFGFSSVTIYTPEGRLVLSSDRIILDSIESPCLLNDIKYKNDDDDDESDDEDNDYDEDLE